MYGVDPAWEVGASHSWYQSGILPAYFTSLHIVSATTQHSSSMAMTGNDTPDALKGLFHPGMVIAENFSAMPPKRRMAQTHDVDLAAQMNELRQMMVPPAPVNQPAAPEIPDVDPVIPENPIAPEVPVAAVVVPPAPLIRTPEELYDKFRRMKAPEFEGSERDKVRRMMRMFHSDLAVVISSGSHPPLTVAECVSRAIRAEYWVGQNKEQRAKFFKEKREERPKLSRTRPDQAKLHNKKVKEDLRVKTTITSSLATTNKRGNGMQEDKGINRIFPKKRMLLLATVIPLVRNVGGGTREIAVLKLVTTFYVAKKATMLELVISIPRIHRTNREDRDLNFMQHR
ncbi:hypothetical protein TIFTF001_044967 [Ficus carica]|uniref:Uncharacterized protein n=1 Tax=Ficus carica TaxID=3494 RepID=A0AA87ZEW0_FICCA|nr:hypothetical protein TIFTF001_044967 [Ficus carica]